MKKNLLFILFLFVIAGVMSTGCSSSLESSKDGPWDYREGYVVAKENGRVLVVRDQVSDFSAPLNDILESAAPNAMWISVSKADLNEVAVGDHVDIHFPNGVAIDQSYPAQTSAEISKK
ncbi:DUF3221 domain-containing protein [Paenibacillus sp. DYY-L-2]|uniref:DUF3221 domain-containing protein n=1 Tax=Paenibacillus sp. DYY-L-2 TaxID=3447013 RepID=UPI003F50157B